MFFGKNVMFFGKKSYFTVITVKHDFFPKESIEKILIEYAAKEGLLSDGAIDKNDLDEMMFFTVTEEFKDKLSSYYNSSQEEIDYENAQKGIDEILNTGKISEEQILSNPDLVLFIEQKLGFNPFVAKDHLGITRSGASEFIRFLGAGELLKKGENDDGGGAPPAGPNGGIRAIGSVLVERHPQKLTREEYPNSKVDAHPQQEEGNV